VVIDYRLVAAAIAPLLLGPWVPRWDDSVIARGLTGAIVSVVSIAVMEEVIFRGGIQSWLLRKRVFKIDTTLGLSRANWLTSSLFAAAHIWQHPLALVPGYLAVSLVLGYFRERYNGIRVPVALHAYFNLVPLFLPKLV
jgi:membrane protease YdiL (CAAX protease family)